MVVIVLVLVPLEPQDSLHDDQSEVVVVGVVHDAVAEELHTPFLFLSH